MFKSLFFVLVAMLATTSTYSKDLPEVRRKLQTSVPVAVPVVTVPVGVPVAVPVAVPTLPLFPKGSKGFKGPKLAKGPRLPSAVVPVGVPSSTFFVGKGPKLSKKTITTGFRGIQLRDGN